MIVEYVRYNVSGSPEAFVEAYAKAADGLRRSPHCLAFELTRCIEESARFVLRIEWDSVEGHLEGFRKSAEFRAFFAAIKPYLDQIEEMHHYAQTSVSSAGPRREEGAYRAIRDE